MRKDVIFVGAWRADRRSGELTSETATERLEPKVMDLLFLLAARPNEVVSRDEIMKAVWPGVSVGEDTLARAVWKLRKALGDDPKAPAYVETLSKRGYRLIADVREASAETKPTPAARPKLVASIVMALCLVIAAAPVLPSLLAPLPSKAAQVIERANDFYFQFTQVDNAAAIALFQRVLADDPEHAGALAGLANALVQQRVRWPQDPGLRWSTATKLVDALKDGRLATPAARAALARAETLAVRAVAIAPRDPAAHKALGFVRSAQGQFAAALTSYERAVALDRDAWGPLINIADVLNITGKSDAALPYLEAAYAAMTRVYDRQSARIRPWHAELGVFIGDEYRRRGALNAAAVWYRRVLATAPFQSAAKKGLSLVLQSSNVR